MKVSEALDTLGRAPAHAGLLAQTADGRWLFVTGLTFTYNPADATRTVPSNVCIEGVSYVSVEELAKRAED